MQITESSPAAGVPLILSLKTLGLFKDLQPGLGKSRGSPLFVSVVEMLMINDESINSR